jgi:isochorismate pyruvate lyase
VPIQPDFLPAEACTSLQEIRTAIDHLDAQMIAVLGQRLEYVKAAAKFKTTEASVRATERVETMPQQRREWAVAVGLSPDMIEQLYRDLIHYFVNLELVNLELQQCEAKP